MAFQNDALMAIAQAVCCKIFFEAFAEKKEDKPVYVPYIILMYLGIILYGLFYWLEDHFVWKEYLVIAVTAILMFGYLKINLAKAFVLSFAFRSIVLVVDYGGLAFVFYYYGNSNEGLLRIYLARSAIASIVFTFFIVTVIRMIAKHRFLETFNHMEWVKFALLPLCSCIMFAALAAAFQYTGVPEQAKVLVFLAIGLFGINILVYFLLVNIIRREREIREQELFALEARSRMERYQSISEHMAKQRKKAHDFKNQILCIEGLLQQKEYGRAQAYVKGISGSLNMEMDAVNTNQTIVNAVLNTKYREAEENRIVFVVIANDLSGIWLEDQDIVVILSNLLDNAIEAAQKCKEKRVIRLKMVLEEDMIISVQNTYADNPAIVDGKPFTSKADKEEHGIGIQNIIEAVEKYKGSYVIKAEEGEFLFSILIPKEP